MANETERKESVRISRSTLQNIFTAAHDKYIEDAEQFARDGSQSMADQFMEQAKQAKGFIDLVEDGDAIDLAD